MDSTENALRAAEAKLKASANDADRGAEAICACPVCGGRLISIRAKLQCSQCHTICETCCEGGRG